MHLTWGEVRSLAACNRLVLGLAERAQAFKTARLESPPPIVLVDGLWLKLAVPTGDIKRDAGGRKRPVKHQEKRGMLTALGVWEDGHWEILTWQLAPGEEAGSWGEFLGTLYRQGLTEATPHLIVSDGAQGLDQALYSHLWGVPHQRCIFHKSKNIAEHLQYTELRAAARETSFAPSCQAKQEYQQAILADASQIYDPDVEGEIRARAQAFQDKWKGREPKAVEVLMTGFEQTLSYLSATFPGLRCR
jgi:transposase-like protein